MTLSDKIGLNWVLTTDLRHVILVIPPKDQEAILDRSKTRRTPVWWVFDVGE